MSCKQFDFGESQENGEYGTVVFDLTGGSNLRSIDLSTGLPNLADSEMKILVEANGQRVQTVEFSGQERRQYKGTFLVGSKVKFTVIVMTKSGKWKGSSEITVASGTNNLSVKLKKAIAELEPLKFKLYEDKTVASNAVQRFSLGFFDDKEPFFKDVEVSDTEYEKKAPSFCRDSKGRTYIFYKNNAIGGDSKIILKRYTSEGKEDSTFSYSVDGSDKTNILVTADNKTGNVFVSYKENATPPQTKLFLVQEGNPAIPKDITPPSGISGDTYAISVYNNIISTVEWDSGSGSGSGYKIKLYKYDGNAPISKIGEGKINQTLLSLKVEGAPSGKEYVSGSFVDSFMNDKNIYLLCRNDDGSGYFISTGGIIKCDYTVQGATGNISEVERLIAKNEYKADEHNIINVKEEDGAKEFYGPQRFVGFNEDVLYIADDGMIREYEAGQAQLLENKNRLVSFNLKSEDIRVKKENLETWLPESKAIAKTKPTLFFSYEKVSQDTFAKIKLHDESGFLHFENSTDEVLSIGRPHTDGLRYIVDSSGNFYVLHEDFSSTNKLEKYSPHKAGNSVVYERDYKFEDIDLKGLTGTNKITRLYYDHVKKDLYYYIDSSELYRLDGNNWGNISRGNYVLKEIMTIYDGRIWAYNDRNKKIESIGIDKNGVLENNATSQFPAPDEIKNNAVLGLSMYKDVLYFLYRDGSGSSFRTPVFALAINKDGNQKQVIGEALYTLEKDLKDIRPIGFDEKTQELKFFRDVVNKDYDGRVSENINGYVAIKYDGNSLAKKEMDNPSDDIKWYAEEKAWQGATDAIMLWNRESFTSPKTKFYALTKEELKKDPATLRPSLASNSSTPYEVYDKFCYDQFGNLYVLIKRHNKYYVVRAKLTENNDYNLSYLGTVLDNDVSFDSSNDAFEVTYLGLSDTTLDKFIMAVYADSDASGTLYYSSIDNPSAIDINKHSFTNDSFKRGIPESFLSGIPTDDHTNLETQLIAIAANKDGVFIAQKELKYVQKDNNRYYESYNIEIRKYPHTSPTYVSPDATINIVGTKDAKVPTNMFDNYDPGTGLDNGKWDEYITENISDMYAYNGVLYALSYKRVGGVYYTSKGGVEPAFKTANVSGAMWKIWNNTKDATGGVTQVFERTSTDKTKSGSFSPKHFIAILPKKLVIASDDYYCWTDDSSQGHAKNYDEVFFFDVDNASMDKDEVEVKAHFSFSYKEDQGTRPASFWDWG